MPDVNRKRIKELKNIVPGKKGFRVSAGKSEEILFLSSPIHVPEKERILIPVVIVGEGEESTIQWLYSSDYLSTDQGRNHLEITGDSTEDEFYEIVEKIVPNTPIIFYELTVENRRLINDLLISLTGMTPMAIVE